MRIVRTTAAGVLVAAVMGAAASPALALPEFSGPFPKTFTATSGGALFETVTAVKVTCKTDVAAGEVTGPQSGTIQITFKGCKSGKTPCNTPGAAPGIIASGILGVRFGYLNKLKKLVGADIFEPAGGPMFYYGCSSAMFAKVIGSVIGQIGPVNKVVTPPSEVFKLRFQQTLGVQKYGNLEGGPTDILETSYGGPFEVTGLANTEAVLFGEPVVLSA